MPELIVTRGIPASGKTTWAMNWIAERPGARARVSRDEIRFTTFGAYHGVDENVVTSILNAQLDALMRSRLNIVVDASHIHPLAIKELRSRARRFRYSLRVRRFDVDLEEAIRRDALRDRSVGREDIERMYLNLVKWDSEPARPIGSQIRPVPSARSKTS